MFNKRSKLCNYTIQKKYKLCKNYTKKNSNLCSLHIDRTYKIYTNKFNRIISYFCTIVIISYWYFMYQLENEKTYYTEENQEQKSIFYFNIKEYTNPIQFNFDKYLLYNHTTTVYKSCNIFYDTVKSYFTHLYTTRYTQ